MNMSKKPMTTEEAENIGRELQLARSKQCPICKGEGKVENHLYDPMQIVDCYWCDGSGTDPDDISRP